MKRSTHVVAWILQVGLGLLIAMGGAAKLGGDAAMVQLFDQLGVGQWFRLAVGALEVAAVILWVRRRELAPRTQQAGDGLVRSP